MNFKACIAAQGLAICPCCLHLSVVCNYSRLKFQTQCFLHLLFLAFNNNRVVVKKRFYFKLLYVTKKTWFCCITFFRLFSYTVENVFFFLPLIWSIWLLQLLMSLTWLMLWTPTTTLVAKTATRSREVGGGRSSRINLYTVYIPDI